MKSLLFSESNFTTPCIPIGLVQPYEVHKPGLTTGPGNIPVTRPYPLVSEASKSILLSSRNLSSTGRSFIVAPAIFRINPAFQLLHLQWKRNQALVLGKGQQLPVGSGGRGGADRYSFLLSASSSSLCFLNRP